MDGQPPDAMAVAALGQAATADGLSTRAQALAASGVQDLAVPGLQDLAALLACPGGGQPACMPRRRRLASERRG